MTLVQIGMLADALVDVVPVVTPAITEKLADALGPVWGDVVSASDGRNSDRTSFVDLMALKAGHKAERELVAAQLAGGV